VCTCEALRVGVYILNGGDRVGGDVFPVSLVVFGGSSLGERKHRRVECEKFDEIA